MHLHALELIKITASAGFRLGSSSCGTITVNGITQVASDTVQPLVSLIAADDNDQVVFASNPSTFDALAAQADNGIHVQADITTDVGVLTFDGDIDDATAEDGHDKVAIFWSSNAECNWPADTGQHIWRHCTIRHSNHDTHSSGRHFGQ